MMAARSRLQIQARFSPARAESDSAGSLSLCARPRRYDAKRAATNAATMTTPDIAARRRTVRIDRRPELRVSRHHSRVTTTAPSTNTASATIQTHVGTPASGAEAATSIAIASISAPPPRCQSGDLLALPSPANARSSHRALVVALRGGCCIIPLSPVSVGGKRSNAANTGLPSHFASRVRAFVWRCPTASELCNSHRAERQRATCSPWVCVTTWG